MTRSNQINMTEGPIFSKLLKFSIPLILSSVLQLLFNAADVVVVGRFAGDNSLAAVGSTGSLVNLLINLFMGLSVGTKRKKDKRNPGYSSYRNSCINYQRPYPYSSRCTGRKADSLFYAVTSRGFEPCSSLPSHLLWRNYSHNGL